MWRHLAMMGEALTVTTIHESSVSLGAAAVPTPDGRAADHRLGDRYRHEHGDRTTGPDAGPSDRRGPRDRARSGRRDDGRLGGAGPGWRVGAGRGLARL